MKITAVRSHRLGYTLPETLGYSQQMYDRRTAHLVEVTTDAGITGWGECFGPGPVAVANQTIVEKVIAPLIVGRDPMAREVLWHEIYNRLRDHGQKGMPLQALSGVDIALWDLAGKATGQSIAQMLGGRFREDVPVYGYGMMLRPDATDLAARFAEEAAAIEAKGFRATKMKIGRGVAEDIRLIEAVRGALKDETRLMVDANHAYHVTQAFAVGRAMEGLGVYWFEEPVAPEDLDGYAELRRGLAVNIAGGEAEFTRWGWRALLEKRCVSIAQPEVCGLGGISEFMKVLTLCQTHMIPVVNHVWGSAVSVATNLQLLAAQPPLPGGLHPDEPMLEYDTTDNAFMSDLPQEGLGVLQSVAKTGRVAIPDRPGHGVVPDPDVLARYRLD
ncbi:mandelate racemase/muconate lactonizing enzyme family protein [Acuticoccus sp. I52.16.1]|uniref:mandelate racemase/muconate lactonizing enzyme family protein n=1 Tax=Acuticoccus sp. I52.16.1 TaxID=2928472 RepID=UPI001FD2FC31|nr:mandelate racemase/muconate lactonizing enzyme family protein [Acuticoccus sp. I52.16.1]UOM36183.1 mandelate racemase/muconate lactonizing enzyme family protein [Acuticoccus sp. I52.16.1]